MDEWKMDDMPLPALFEEASKIHAVASGSSVDQDVVRKGIQTLRRCDEMISKLGLFSSNETKDDVSTANLKYLLVPYYIGELTEKVVEDDRIKVLKTSQDHLKEFISICETLELVPEVELESSSQGGPDNLQHEEQERLPDSSGRELQKQSCKRLKKKEKGVIGH